MRPSTRSRADALAAALSCAAADAVEACPSAAFETVEAAKLVYYNEHMQLDGKIN